MTPTRVWSLLLVAMGEILLGFSPSFFWLLIYLPKLEQPGASSTILSPNMALSTLKGVSFCMPVSLLNTRAVLSLVW